MSEWDVIVVGSGAGAMTAAVRAHDLGLKTLVLEKSDKFGGTSAVSGGGIWIPVNPQMPSVGREDNFEDAWTYLTASTKGQVPEVKLRTYMDNGPRLLAYLKEKTRLSFRAVGAYPDYYQHLPGVRPGGRTMEPAIFDRFQLGDAIKDMRGAERGGYLFGRMNMDQTDAAVLMGASLAGFCTLQ
jgi:3-oxosteroid 1-dehydrogenase